MATRAEFFASLQPCAIESTPMPDLAMATIDAPSREHFARVLEEVGGRLATGSRFEDVRCRAAELVRQQRQVLSMVEGVEGNRNPDAIDEPRQLKDIDYCIAPARLAVAENGSLWFSGEDLIARNAIFICEHLIGVVNEDRIVATMDEAMGLVGKLGGGWGVFVSGPSKTADIEQTLVIGAQGARSMQVYLLHNRPETAHDGPR